MNGVFWTTTIEQKIGRRWVEFSRQAIEAGERGRTDAEYLAACRERFPDLELRVKASGETLHVAGRGEMPNNAQTLQYIHKLSYAARTVVTFADGCQCAVECGDVEGIGRRCEYHKQLRSFDPESIWCGVDEIAGQEAHS